MNKDKKGEQNIVVEIPVVLEKANVIFNMDHLAFAFSNTTGISTTMLSLPFLSLLFIIASPCLVRSR